MSVPLSPPGPQHPLYVNSAVQEVDRWPEYPEQLVRNVTFPPFQRVGGGRGGTVIVIVPRMVIVHGEIPRGSREVDQSASDKADIGPDGPEHVVPVVVFALVIAVVFATIIFFVVAISVAPTNHHPPLVI